MALLVLFTLSTIDSTRLPRHHDRIHPMEGLRRWIDGHDDDRLRYSRSDFALGTDVGSNRQLWWIHPFRSRSLHRAKPSVHAHGRGNALGDVRSILGIRSRLHRRRYPRSSASPWSILDVLCHLRFALVDQQSQHAVRCRITLFSS